MYTGFPSFFTYTLVPCFPLFCYVFRLSEEDEPLASDQRFSANFQGQGRRPMAESLWVKIKLESCFYDSQTQKKLRSFADVSYRNTKLSISQAEPRA